MRMTRAPLLYPLDKPRAIESLTRMPFRFRLLAVVVSLGLALTAACGGSSPASGTNAPKTRRIAVIPKGTTHEFWKSIHAGAVKATQELAQQGDTVSIIWKGPLREDDREQQVQVVEGFLSQ